MDLPNSPLIQRLPPLRDLAPRELAGILADARLLALAEGATACTQGGRADAFFLLASGRLKVVQVTAEGQRIIAHFVLPGQFFGIAVALGRGEYPGTAIAAIDSLALCWPASMWSELASRHPGLAEAALRDVGGYLDEAFARLREGASVGVEQRIARALLRLLRPSERGPGRAVEIAFPVTRQDVAEMASTTLHTASRTLHAWEQAGILSGGRRRIVILDAPRLAHMAGEA